MVIDGVKVTINKAVLYLTEDEIRQYISYARERTADKGELTSLTINPGREPGEVALVWEAQGQKFERIRRITGYLVGTIDRWNNAKKAEEKERVKHA